MSAAEEYLPRPGEFDPLAAEANKSETKTGAPEKPSQPLANAPVLRVFSLSEILSYEPPAGSLLVGDGVLELGEIALLYGPPGSFKGFAVGHLMACGA